MNILCLSGWISSLNDLSWALDLTRLPDSAGTGGMWQLHTRACMLTNSWPAPLSACWDLVIMIAVLWRRTVKRLLDHEGRANASIPEWVNYVNRRFVTRSHSLALVSWMLACSSAMLWHSMKRSPDTGTMFSFPGI